MLKKKLQLLKLQIKSAFISIPKILLGTFIIGFFVILLSIGIAKTTSKNKDMRMKVAVVYSENDQDKYVRMAFNFISEVDTVNNVCTFDFTSKEEAFNGLRNNTYVMAILVPDNLIRDIMNGTNTPIEVVYSSAGVNNTSMIFREMLSAGGSDLGTAEAGIYTVDDLFYGVLKNYRADRGKHEDKLNEVYLNYALNRSIYFDVRDLAVKEGLSVVQFYVCTAAVMLLLLSGITCISNLKPESRALNASLKTQGIHGYEYGLCKTLGLTLVYTLLLACGLSVAMLMSIRFKAISDIIMVYSFGEWIKSVIGMLILVFSVFSFIYCIFTVVRNPVYSVLVLFLAGMLFMYASGCFVSSALLPAAVRNIGSVLPTSGYFDLAGEIIRGTTSLLSIVKNVFWIIIFQTVAALAMRIHRH